MRSHVQAERNLLLKENVTIPERDLIQFAYVIKNHFYQTYAQHAEHYDKADLVEDITNFLAKYHIEVTE